MILRDFFPNTTETIFQCIQKTHGLILGGEEVASPLRSKILFISDDFTAAPDDIQRWKVYQKIFRDQRGEERDLPLFKLAFDKMTGANSFDEGWALLTDEEKRAWSIAFYVPLLPAKIEGELRIFIEELKAKMSDVIDRRTDAFEVAAWAHKRIGEIHPFNDGNGRSARIWMNAILRIGGCLPSSFRMKLLISR